MPIPQTPAKALRVAGDLTGRRVRIIRPDCAQSTIKARDSSETNRDLLPMGMCKRWLSSPLCRGIRATQTSNSINGKARRVQSVLDAVGDEVNRSFIGALYCKIIGTANGTRKDFIREMVIFSGYSW